MKSRVIQDESPEPGPPAGPANRQEAPVSGFRAHVRAHRVRVFFALAYVLAWGAIPWNSFLTPVSEG